MRFLPPALLSFALLAGCAGYTIDYVKPKEALIARQLARYGLGADEARCVKERLAGALSVWQLRQFADAADAGLRPDANWGEPRPRHLLFAATLTEDEAILPAVTRAAETCGLGEEAGPAGTEAGRYVVMGPGTLPPPSGAAEPTAETDGVGGKKANGPPGYRPSDRLLMAIEAYEKGDFAEALTLTREAAGQGDNGAPQLLAGLYASGQGVKADPAAAAQWLRIAAEQGWSEAMNNLGQAYEKGAGVAADPVEALKWYLLASRRDTEDPALVAGNIASLSGRLTLEQIEEAGRRVRAWEAARER